MTDALTDVSTEPGRPQQLERPGITRPADAALLVSAAPGSAPLVPPPPVARRRALPKVLLAVADLLAVGLGLLAASLAGHGAGASTAALSVPLWLLFLAESGLYQARNLQRFATEVRGLLHAAALSMGGTALVSLLLGRAVSREWLLLAFGGATVALVAERAAARAAFAALRRRGRLARRMVAVGADADGCELVSLLEAQQELGYRVIGFADDLLPVGTMAVEGVAVLGTTEDIPALLRATGAEGVLLSTSSMEPAGLNHLVRRLGDAGIHVELSTPCRSVAIERLTVRSVGTRFTTLHLAPRDGSRWTLAGKRAFDIVVALVGLVVASPVMVVAALAIKLDTRGPVLFRQTRLGRGGTPFKVLKLRSMVVDAERMLQDLRHLNEVQWPLFKVRADPRTTRVGRFIRALSIDELPQLWNVLRGEMSLVGPRPALPGEIHGWSLELHRRLLVRPGITGMWQVSGRSDATFEDYMHLDLYYIDNWSLSMDVRILLRTVPSVLLQRGAH
ncbi:MAG: sugar transferase [Actinomycetota bacterium]|nr:sugar transferase [Actinomycetota bacterium]